MKKSVKIILTILILAAAAVGSVFYMTLPLPVRMTEISPRSAELSFSEQGVVNAGGTILVFSSAQGEISELHVREGQSIRAGEALVSVDDTGLRLRLEQVQSGIQSLEAQLDNVSIEAASIRQSLNSTLGSLQGELRAINAQAAQSNSAFANHEEILREQTRVQQVLITQHERDLTRVEENLRHAQLLYASGAMPRVDYAAAASAVTTAMAQLEAAEGQMAIIAAGGTQSTAEHFEGIRASLNAQIAGIHGQLATDTTTAARAHFEALIAIEKLSAQAIKRDIENALITAPASGIITTLHAQNTNFISTAQPVAELMLDASPVVEVYVSTQDVSSINIGDRVRLVLRQRMNDIEFYGYVSEIDNAAVVRFSALGVEERKVSVTIEPQIPTGTELGAGFAVDVTFFVFYEENRIVVPRTAVFRENGVDMVWAISGSEGALRAVPVVTGMELRTDIIIESGLGAGYFVVNNANNSDLREGVRVINE